MHILVVDDDIPTVEVIRTSLHWDLLGIDRVETAYDYTEAQNKICASQPDIILCDIEMPRGSGLDLLRWLREERAKRSAHFLLEVDGGVDDTTAPLCVEAGADILVAGNYVFGAENPLERISTLKNL